VTYKEGTYRFTISGWGAGAANDAGADTNEADTNKQGETIYGEDEMQAALGAGNRFGSLQRGRTG
jgi:hypothetical protein